MTRKKKTKEDPLILSGCPYQKGLTTNICEASRLMVPSVEEKKKFCEGNFRNCPYYREAILRDMDTLLRDAPKGAESIR